MIRVDRLVILGGQFGRGKFSWSIWLVGFGWLILLVSFGWSVLVGQSLFDQFRLVSLVSFDWSF